MGSLGDKFVIKNSKNKQENKTEQKQKQGVIG